jgi:hypothetical protein
LVADDCGPVLEVRCCGWLPAWARGEGGGVVTGAPARAAEPGTGGVDGVPSSIKRNSKTDGSGMVDHPCRVGVKVGAVWVIYRIFRLLFVAAAGRWLL